jgi:hypothetical protein
MGLIQNTVMASSLPKQDEELDADTQPDDHLPGFCYAPPGAYCRVNGPST